MLSAASFGYLLALIAFATGFDVNIQSNCPESMKLLQNDVYEGLDMIPGRVGWDLSAFDPDVFLFSLSASGTHAGFNMANGEYFILKNTSFFDVGINIEPIDFNTGAPLSACPNVICNNGNCTTAFTQMPTLNPQPPSSTPVPPLFVCPGEDTIFRVTFCPLNTPADPGAVALTFHPKGDTQKCMDVRGNIRANGTPVQAFDCNKTPAQQWSLLGEVNTQVKLTGTNFCLDAGSNPAEGIQLKIWECFAGLPQQTWIFGDAIHKLTLANAVDIGGVQGFLCLDDTNGNLTNGQTLQTWECVDNNVNQMSTISV